MSFQRSSTTPVEPLTRIRSPVLIFCVATERIKTGDRVRVNGTSGVVEVLR